MGNNNTKEIIIKETIYDNPQPNTNYIVTRSEQVKGTEITLLMKWVMITKEYPELHDNIRKLILDNPNTVNELGACGISALLLASRNSNIFSTNLTVKLLIDSGANINMQSVAHSKDDSSIETIKLLIDAGANVNFQSNNKKTALMLAVIQESEHLETIKLLIESGADVNLQEQDGNTALMLAIMKTLNENVIKMLIDAGTNLSLQNRDKKNAYDLMLMHSPKTNKILENYYHKMFFNKLLQGRKISTSSCENARSKAVEDYVIMKHYYDNVFKKVIVNASKIKLKDKNMGSKIVELDYRLKITSAVEIYNKMKENNDPVLDYFGVIDENDLSVKIKDYICYI